MRRRTAFGLGLIPLSLLLARSLPSARGSAYIALDASAQPLKQEFNADVGKVRLLMYVSPTCGECLRGAKQTQQQVLAAVANPNLRIYVVWAPKNGGREQDVRRVTDLVTDPRAIQYWDGRRAVTAAYDSMFALTGPCAGIFTLYGPQAHWKGAAPPRPDYVEDAHAHEFQRPYPQFEARRLADKVRGMLGA